MLVHDMSHQDCFDLLGRARLGRLACSQGVQPYIVPAFFAFEDHSLYCCSNVGQKIEWMRTNPFVSVEFEEGSVATDWATVIVTGKFEELPSTPDYDAQRTRAYLLLQKHPGWWEPSYAKTVIEGETRPLALVYFRILIEGVSGRRGMPDKIVSAPARKKQSLVSRLLRAVSNR